MSIDDKTTAEQAPHDLTADGALAEKPKSRKWRIAAVWLVIIAALVVAYADNFQHMWRRWFPRWHRAEVELYDKLFEGESYYTHGPLIPLISAILVIMVARHAKIPVRPSPGWGLAALGLSLLMHLMSCLARVHFISSFTLLGVFAGLILIFWGWPALRRLWFPVAILAFMVPLPEVTIAQTNFRLKMLASRWGVEAANMIGILAERHGNKVFLEGDKSLVIANVCNGLRTLISLLATGALYAYVCHVRGAWRVVLFLLTIPIAVVANAIRIVSLILVADVWSVQAATGWWHDFSGLLIFVIALLLLYGLEHVILFGYKLVGKPIKIGALLGKSRRDPEDIAQWGRLIGAAGTRAGCVATGLFVFTAFGAVWLNQVVPIPIGGLEQARKSLPVALNVEGKRWEGIEREMDARTLDVLETDTYVFRTYVRTDEGAAFRPSGSSLDSVDFCVILSKDNRKGVHPPDLCLEGGSTDVVGKRDVSLTVSGLGELTELPCRELVVQGDNRRTYFLYTYMCGDSYTRSFWWQQGKIFLNGLLRRNALGGLVRVSTPIRGDAESARNRSMAFMRVAVPELHRGLQQWRQKK